MNGWMKTFDCTRKINFISETLALYEMFSSLYQFLIISRFEIQYHYVTVIVTGITHLLNYIAVGRLTGTELTLHDVVVVLR